MTKENEFIESLEGDLTPEQVEQLISGEQGETSEELDAEGSAPSTDDTSEGKEEQKSGEVGESDASEEELNAENAAVLARDGKHLISYDKLAEARQLAQQERQRAEEAMQELERMRQEAQQRAHEGQQPTKQDNQSAVAEEAIKAGVDADLFGDFSEEALAKGIEKLVAQQVEQRVGQALQPIQQREAHSATESHYNAIYDAHPDADSIAESQELADWIAGQPSFTQVAMQQVLQSGSTEQVIELFSAFKGATDEGETQKAIPESKEDAIKEAAKQKVKGQKAPVPASLSQFPGGKAASTDKADAMADMGGVDLVDAMADMTPDQIEAFMNRL